MNRVVMLRTFLRAGVLRPGPPHRQVAQLHSLLRWGYGLGGELRQAAKRSPGAVAVIDDERGPISYADLLDRAEWVGSALRDLEVTAGRRVGLLARNHVGAIEVIAGASLVGLDVVLINTGLSPEQVVVVAEEQQLAVLIHDDEFADLVASLGAMVEVMGESALVARVAAMARQSLKPRLAPPARPGRTIVLTSGTTGAPKGAARRTPPGPSALVTIIDRIPLRTADTVLVSAPIFHTWGYAAIQLAFGLRATVVLQRRFDPAHALRSWQTHDVDAMIAIPVMLQRILDLPEQDRANARPPRVIATSGSAYPHGFATRFMDAFGDILYNLYGSTEASWVCIATPSQLRRYPDTAGTPPLGTIVRVLDDDGVQVPEGVVGRVCAHNDMVFEGYTSGESSRPVADLLATGDVGRVHDGLLFVVGRVDDMIVSGGENVYPMEVESLLAEHPAVHEACVIGVPDEAFGQRLAAFVVRRPGASLSADEIADYVRAHRARHCIPREVRFVDDLPRNATGKVLARELRALL